MSRDIPGFFMKNRKSISVKSLRAFPTFVEQISDRLDGCRAQFNLTDDIELVVREEDTEFKEENGKLIFVAKKQSFYLYNLEKIIIRNKDIQIGLIQTLQRLINIFKYRLRVLRLEDCNLTAAHIETLSDFLQTVPSLQYVSVNGNPNKEQNHYLLLLDNHILILSLRFCGINVEGMKQISNLLVNNINHPLMHLNLASNCLFDDGTECLEDALRINRNIVSLNLTDNKIRTKGLQSLLNPLVKYQLTDEEIAIKRKLTFDYYKKQVKEGMFKSDGDIKKKHKDKILRDGKFQSFFTETEYHPFLHDAVEAKGDIFCVGNYAVTRLNLSYNRLTKGDLESIIKTLTYQRNIYPNDKGLSRIIAEGNDFGNDCAAELNEIKTLCGKVKQSKTRLVKTSNK